MRRDALGLALGAVVSLCACVLLAPAASACGSHFAPDASGSEVKPLTKQAYARLDYPTGERAIWDWYRDGRVTLGFDLSGSGFVLDESPDPDGTLKGAGYGLLGLRFGMTVADGLLLWSGVGGAGIGPVFDHDQMTSGPGSTRDEAQFGIGSVLGLDYMLSPTGDAGWRLRGMLFAARATEEVVPGAPNRYLRFSLSFERALVVFDGAGLLTFGVFTEATSAEVTIRPPSDPSVPIAYETDVFTVGMVTSLVWFWFDTPWSITMRGGAGEGVTSFGMALRTGLAF